MSLAKYLLPAALLLGTAPAFAQYQQRNGDFHRGLRDGGRNGRYDDSRYGSRYGSRYDSRYGHDEYYNNNQHQGGIGPGKGALIGGAGGAVLGALFGGGLRGTIIGGAAGAGIGAVIGESQQNNRRDRRYGYPR
jgi:hypothetical protein